MPSYQSKIVIIAIIVLTALSSCSKKPIASLGSDFDESKRFAIKKHQTSQKQLIAILGQPTKKISYSADNQQWIYEYALLRQSATILQFDQSPIASDKKLVVFFNDSATVQDYIYTDSDRPVMMHKPLKSMQQDH